MRFRGSCQVYSAETCARLAARRIAAQDPHHHSVARYSGRCAQGAHHGWLSDWSICICKCRYSFCGRYFLLEKPRKSYLHGTFCCPKHRSLASAAACTGKRRAEAENELIDVAARQLLRWHVDGPHWHDVANRKQRLAAALSLYIGRKRLQSYRQEVKANWITRHRLRIEQKRAQTGQKLKVAID